MSDHKVYAENGRTVIQVVGNPIKSVVRVDVEINHGSPANTVRLQNIEKATQSWPMKYEEIYDKLGVQIDPTGADENLIQDYITLVTAF